MVGSLKPIVISLGGSILNDEKGRLDLGFIKRFSELILKLKKRGQQIVIAVGGGATAREYVNAVRQLSSSEFLADRIGIVSTRMNALLLISVFGQHAYQRVIEDLDEAPNVLQLGVIPVAGGLLEGVTTDTVSALLAEIVDAKMLVNLSNTKGVYDDDPRANPRAKKIPKMSHEKLVELAAKMDKRTARTNFPFDLMACKICARSNIPLHFLQGRDLKQVENSLSGKAHEGTVVVD